MFDPAQLVRAHLRDVEAYHPVVPFEVLSEELGFPPERRVQDLTDAEILLIREKIDRELTVEGDLRRQTAMNIAATTGPVIKPCTPKLAMPPMVDNSTTKSGIRVALPTK